MNLVKDSYKIVRKQVPLTIPLTFSVEEACGAAGKGGVKMRDKVNQ